MKQYNNNRSKDRRVMKIPTLAVLFALSTHCMPASTVSASNIDSQSILSIIREEAASSSNNLTNQIKRHRRRLPPSAHHHRELHPHHSSWSSLCSCSPTTFELRLDFSKDCSHDTIKTNAGIRGTLCLLGEAGSVGVDPLLPLPLPPPPPAPNSSQTIPPVMGSEPATDAPTSSTYYPTFSPTDGESTDPVLPPANDGGSDGGTTNTVVPMETYYPTFGPTISEDGTESDSNMPPANNAAITPLPTYTPTASVVAEPTRGKGKAVKGRNHAAPGNDNNVDTSLKWIFSDSISSLEEPTIPTYYPTTLEARTPYPTDDLTYAPTFSDTARSSLSSTYAPTTLSHAKNLGDHTMAESVQNRQLQEKTRSVIGKWTSIPPNDEFFRKFPEWKARQEEIYQLKRSMLSEPPAAAVHEHSSRRNLQEEETPTSYPTYLTTIADTTTEEEEPDDNVEEDANANSNYSPTTTPTYFTTDMTNEGDEGSSAIALIPNQLLSAQFLEMDTSPNMNIINQDDQYIDFSSSSEASGPSSSSITSFTLSYTSISAYLNPNIPLDEQLEYVPGGAILILVGQTEEGEIVRNRVMWTYTMGCNTEDRTVEVGDVFGWTMFDNLDPAIPEFCPASSSGGSGSNIPTYMPTSEAVSASSKANKPSSKSSKPHKPSSSSSSSEDASEDESSSDSKSGKPGLSMPSSGDLVDHFDFGKSGKSTSTSSLEHQSKSSKTSSTHSEDEESSIDEEPSEEEIASMPSGRLLHIDIEHPHDFDLNQLETGRDEEYSGIFGRRLSQRRETTSREGGIFVSNSGETHVKGPRFDKPLKKRLRNRSV